MITNLATNTPSWQEQLAGVLTSPAELFEYLQLSPEALGFAQAALEDFPLRIPRPYLQRIRPGDPADPLLLQVLPQYSETLAVAGFSPDPLNEASVNPHSGVLHKYRGRALLIVTQSCAIHCRYCFRRHFPYADNRPGRAQWRDALAYIANDCSIKEVILSGGDPLATSNSYLRWLLDELAAIGHVQRLRLHTRLPIMLPDRVDRELLQMLAQWRGRAVVVLHSNHARELDAAVDRACREMKDSGATLLNQSVLLKGVNDSVEALCELSERLFAAGVLPYYLHTLDPVQGAAHFDVPDDTARRLISAVRSRLPGYLVPTLVREHPGAGAKTPLDAPD